MIVATTVQRHILILLRHQIEYCNNAPDSDASFAGRWAAKEAVFKALGVASKGAGASMKDIEIQNTDVGPIVSDRSSFHLYFVAYESVPLGQLHW